MNKKNYIIIGVTILIFGSIIITILLSGNKNTNWISDILNSQNYQITMTDCNGREKKLDKQLLNYLSDNWNNISNNGPWTGNDNICYTSLSISYENNGIINTKELLLIDDTSLALIENNNSIYYTNANEIINYLNSLFTID